MSFTRKSPPLSPTSKAAIRSRSPPLAPLPSLSTTLPGLTAFDRAVHVVNISNTTTQGYNDGSQSGSGDRVVFTPEEQLLLYGAYKQATKGDVKGLKPTFFDIAARSKWQAWANMRGKTKDEASDTYVDLVVKSLTKSGSHPDHHVLADEILQRPSTPPPSSLEKDLPPIHFDESSPTTATTTDATAHQSHAHAANLSNALHLQHQRQQRPRKGSISHSIRSTTTGGLQSSAPSVYELASESLEDQSTTGNATTEAEADPGYHDITETVVEEEILDEDEYAAEVQKATSGSSAPTSPRESTFAGEDRRATAAVQEDDDDDEDEVYQSSEEYEEDGDSDESGSDSSKGSVGRSSTESKREKPTLEPLIIESQAQRQQQEQHVEPPRRRLDEPDDFVDEGVFDEEEKDEQEAEVQELLESPRAPNELYGGEYEEHVEAKAPISRTGSVSSGYGGSVFSDKEQHPTFNSNGFDLLSHGQDVKQHHTVGLASPLVEPYRVNALFDVTISPLDPDYLLHSEKQDQKSTVDLAAGRLDTPPAYSAPQPVIPCSEPAAVTSSASLPSSPRTSSPSSFSGATQELVCPVSKKSASSGGVCPASMFAQARAAAAATAQVETPAEAGASQDTQNTEPSADHAMTRSPSPVTPIVASRRSSNSSSRSSSPLNPSKPPHHRSLTEPASAYPNNSNSSSSSSSSAVAAATNQGKRIGQGIVSRFTALRSSLAAASGRAASLALTGSSTTSLSSNSTNISNAVVVEDPVTHQPITVVCPHGSTTRVLETEMVRLQTDISVLHERLDLLQESLKIKSQTRELERRSARGILKLVLRQGLINAVLLLIVFAVLYKRKSPIAFAILAYVGQGRREGEAGWRAFMRWTADLLRTGQRNQQAVMRAGRRNGYW